MVPSAITVENFRCYRRAQRFDLKPITVFFGRNNSGKSAIMRLFPMLADSFLSDGLDALRLDKRLVGWSHRFRTLRSGDLAPTDDPTIGITLEFAAQPVQSVTWRLFEPAEWNRIVVNNFNVQYLEVSAELELRGPFPNDRLSLELPYRAGNAKESRKAFHGLNPAFDVTDSAKVNQFLRELQMKVVWLHALRQVPARETRFNGPVRWELEPSGKDAPILLFGQDAVRKSVAAWFEKHARHRLLIEEDPPQSRLVASRIRPLTKLGFNIDLIDAGEGLGQLLSVLTGVELLRHRSPESGPDVLAIEEPEAHLHKDLQRALVDELVAVTQLQTGGITLLETHAETILLSLQLAVADGRLRREDLAIYWVRNDDGNATAERVELGPDGWFDAGWPPSALGEDRELRAALQTCWDSMSESAV
ncbi:MAG TPA: AAA family ATPase [Myxococcota bacterium]|nr:AAA family ATPase [Myxococcota bacterium]